MAGPSYRVLFEQRMKDGAAKSTPQKDVEIPIARKQNYDRCYFKEGHFVLQGFTYPLDSEQFEMAENLNATGHWRDDLSAYDLDSRNLSYPEE